MDQHKIKKLRLFCMIAQYELSTAKFHILSEESKPKYEELLLILQRTKQRKY